MASLPADAAPAAIGWRRAVFPALLVACGLLYVWRMSGVAAFPPVTDHLSNVYLTAGAVTLLSGSAAFTDPARRGRVLVVALTFVAVNVVAEVLLGLGGLERAVNDAMGGVNTADPLDGLAGTAAALGVLLLRAPTRPR